MPQTLIFCQMTASMRSTETHLSISFNIEMTMISFIEYILIYDAINSSKLTNESVVNLHIGYATKTTCNLTVTDAVYLNPSWLPVARSKNLKCVQMHFFFEISSIIRDI